MIKHTKQIEALNDQTRFQFWLVGRRGGKTIGLVEKLCESVASAPQSSDIVYIAPTLQQAYELVWDLLVERFDQLGWRYVDQKSKRRFEFRGNINLYVLGAEKIRRIRGHKVWFLCLDELAFFETPLKEVWRACRPTLSDLKGKAILATTPNGKNTDAYDFYLEALSKKDWKIFSWTTFENPFISKEEIESARHELDERSFNQEYLAQWVAFETLVYYNFDENIHVTKQNKFDAKKPLVLCFDFNVNPTTLLLRQSKIVDNREVLCYLKEYSLKHSSTLDTVRKFCEEYKDFKHELRLKIRGDSTGSARSSPTGKSDYYYVLELLKEYGFMFDFEVLAKNPVVVDRIMHVNSYLRNFRGEHRIEIDPTCVELIRDLSSQETKSGQRLPDDKNNLGHKADALGYDVYYDYISRSKKPTQIFNL